MHHRIPLVCPKLAADMPIVAFITEAGPVADSHPHRGNRRAAPARPCAMPQRCAILIRLSIGPRHSRLGRSLLCRSSPSAFCAPAQTIHRVAHSQFTHLLGTTCRLMPYGLGGPGECVTRADRRPGAAVVAHFPRRRPRGTRRSLHPSTGQPPGNPSTGPASPAGALQTAVCFRSVPVGARSTLAKGLPAMQFVAGLQPSRRLDILSPPNGSARTGRGRAGSCPPAGRCSPGRPPWPGRPSWPRRRSCAGPPGWRRCRARGRRASRCR